MLVSTGESRSDYSRSDRTLLINGQHWTLIGPYPTDNKDAIPPYACVSYVWGANRLDNPLFPTHLMSDQTLLALRAVIRAASSEISAFWVDVFCVPYHQPARSATLESMGYIYSAADRVVAALGPEHCEALLEMTKYDWLSEQLLTSFESNAWVTSVCSIRKLLTPKDTSLPQWLLTRQLSRVLPSSIGLATQCLNIRSNGIIPLSICVVRGPILTPLKIWVETT